MMKINYSKSYWNGPKSVWKFCRYVWIKL